MADKFELSRISRDALTSLVNDLIDQHAQDQILTKEELANLYEDDHCRSNDLASIELVIKHQTGIFEAAMKELGFKRITEKFFEHPDCPFIINFFPPLLTLGREPIKKVINFMVADRSLASYRDKASD